MAEQPWFKFYAADYLLDPDVDAMPREAEALLLRIWCICHREGSCPADPETLARKTLCALQYVLQYKLHCEPFFELRDGKLYSRRMEEEKHRSEIARANANRRYEKNRVEHSKSKSESKSESESESERGSANSTATRSAVSTANRSNAVALPDWIPVDPWSGFVEMRKRIRKPLTQRAIGLIVTKLQTLEQQGYDSGEVLDQSTRNCWQDVFELKGSNGTGNRAQQRQDSNIEAGRAAIELLKRRQKAREDDAATDSPGDGVQGDANPGVLGHLCGKPI